MVAVDPIESPDDLERQEQDFFKHLVQKQDAGEYLYLEKEANQVDGLFSGEKFYLRFVEKNFDGSPIGRWIFFCEKPPNQFFPGRSRFITALTAEPPGLAGQFSVPRQVHVDGLQIMILDWRQGRHAALERLEEMKEAEETAILNDAVNEAEGKVDDIFWVWKRAMGENLDFRLGPDGSGPNHGSKHFGKVFDKNTVGL